MEMHDINDVCVCVRVCGCILVLKIVNWIDYDVELSFKCFHTLVDSIFYIGQLNVVIVAVYCLYRMNVFALLFGIFPDECLILD